jgi:hypothetical protein
MTDVEAIEAIEEADLEIEKLTEEKADASYVKKKAIKHVTAESLVEATVMEDVITIEMIEEDPPATILEIEE